jgi:hypothetical protein
MERRRFYFSQAATIALQILASGLCNMPHSKLEHASIHF